MNFRASPRHPKPSSRSWSAPASANPSRHLKRCGRSLRRPARRRSKPPSSRRPTSSCRLTASFVLRWRNRLRCGRSNAAGPRSNTAAPDATAADSTPGEPISQRRHLPLPPPRPRPRRLDGASCGEADAPQSDASASPPVSPQAPLFFKLASPMRLNPQVRDALGSAIDSLNLDPRESLVVTVPTGVFVPLSHFKRARLDIPVVLRALSETGMSLRPPNGRSRRHRRA